MRLNPDCIRDILLTVEEKTGFPPIIEYPDDMQVPRLNNYSEDEIFYHLSQCEQSNLINKLDFHSDGCIVHGLTPSGHRFIEDIRLDTNWNKTKEISKNIGSSSLDTLKQISIGVISELIKSQLQL